MTFEQKLEKKELAKDIQRLSNRISIVLIIVIATTNILFLGIRSLFPDFYSLMTEEVFDEMNFSLIVQFFFVMLPAMLIYAKLTGAKLTSFFTKPDISIGRVLKWFLIGFFLSTSINLVVQLITLIVQTITDTTMGQVQFIADRNPLNATIFFVFVAIGAPIFEELYFRGLFLSKLMKYGSAFAIIVTGVLFGLYHMNLPQIFPAAMLGLVFAFVTVKSRSVLPAMLMHFMNNCVGGMGQLIAGGMDIDKISSGDMNYISEHMSEYLGLLSLGMVIICALTAGMVLFIIQLANAKWRGQLALGEQKAPELSLGEKVAAFFFAPGTIVLILIMIASTVLTIVGLRT